MRAAAVRLRRRGERDAAGRSASTTRGSTSSGTATVADDGASTACAASAPSTRRTRMPPSGWPIGQGVGYGVSFVNQAADLLERWPDGPWEPDLAHGARVQAVCEAMERAAAERRWVRVDEVAERVTVRAAVMTGARRDRGRAVRRAGAGAGRRRAARRASRASAGPTSTRSAARRSSTPARRTSGDSLPADLRARERRRRRGGRRRGARRTTARRSALGDRIVPGANVPCGRCWYCTTGEPYYLCEHLEDYGNSLNVSRAALALRRLGRADVPVARHAALPRARRARGRARRADRADGGDARRGGCAARARRRRSARASSCSGSARSGSAICSSRA